MLILVQQQFPTSVSFFNYRLIEPNPVLNLTHSDSVKLPVAISKRTLILTDLTGKSSVPGK